MERPPPTARPQTPGPYSAHPLPSRPGRLSGGTGTKSLPANFANLEKKIAAPRQMRLPETLSDDQVRQLLSGIYSPVYRTCLSLMYACGLRIGEATKLEISAIDRANLVLRIVGKDNKERLVPLPQPILDELGHLWRSHHNPRWLFPNQNGDG